MRDYNSLIHISDLISIMRAIRIQAGCLSNNCKHLQSAPIRWNWPSICRFSGENNYWMFYLYNLKLNVEKTLDIKTLLQKLKQFYLFSCMILNLYHILFY